MISTSPKQGCEVIIVIPCFREPDILKTLRCLTNCDLPDTDVEVIILINHSEIEDQEIKKINADTKSQIESWIQENKSSIDFYPVGPIELPKKWAGAGLARKSGMDEAVRRFNLLEKPDGIIVSLDADTLLEKNYLTEIRKHFVKNPKQIGATIAFQHQKKGLEKRHLQGIVLYEKYMEYYKNALKFTGFPNPMFTVGSAFAVKAGAYVKRGGMNRRQAGEDFYFLQGLTEQGIVGEINSTKVYPSSRLSDRVPFGTGPILQKWMKGEEDLTKTYNFRAFLDLKAFFDSKNEMFKKTESEYHSILNKLPACIMQFLIVDNFWVELNDLNDNCSTIQTFQKRFFQKFNAFKVLKFLNFAHEHFYEKGDLDFQIECLNNSN